MFITIIMFIFVAEVNHRYHFCRVRSRTPTVHWKSSRRKFREFISVTRRFYNVYAPASSADACCFSKTPPCLALKNGRQPAKRLPENVRFTASLLRLAASNSSSEYISQTMKNSGEILKQLDSQGISFFKLINIFERSVADVHKKANWLGRIEWHLWCMLYL